MTIIHEHDVADERSDLPADLLSLNKEMVRSLHLLARDLDDAVHAHCVHEPLGHAHDVVLRLAVRLQIALRDIN